VEGASLLLIRIDPAVLNVVEAARPLHHPLYGRLAPASACGPPPAASRGR
jgi:hypothetical protein